MASLIQASIVITKSPQLHTELPPFAGMDVSIDPYVLTCEQKVHHSLGLVNTRVRLPI